MVFSFKYKPIKLSKRIIYRPLIKLTIQGNSQSFDIFALLDSGSDIAVIPLDIAELLGLEFIGENKLSGITNNKLDVKQSKMSVIVGKGHEQYKFTIPVLVPINRDFNKIIIGRAGFFNQFNITFD